MKRRTPVRHKVQGHYRQGKWVDSFERGSGTRPSKPRRVVKNALSRRRYLWEAAIKDIPEITYGLEGVNSAHVIGSFASKKEKPGDIDIVLFISPRPSLERGSEFIEWDDIHYVVLPDNEWGHQEYEDLVAESKKRYGEVKTIDVSRLITHVTPSVYYTKASKGTEPRTRTPRYGSAVPDVLIAEDRARKRETERVQREHWKKFKAQYPELKYEDVVIMSETAVKMKDKKVYRLKGEE